MKNSMTRKLGVSAVVLVSLLTAACGSDTEGDDSGGGASATITQEDVAGYLEQPNELVVTTPVSGPVPEGLEIAFVSNGTPQVQKVQSGLESAAEVLGWDVRVSTYEASNPATLTTAIESAIAEEPAAVVLGSVQLEQIESSIPEAVAADVPIVLFASPNPEQDGVYAVGDTSVGFTYNGTMIGETIVADAAEEGESASVVQLTVSAYAAVLGYIDEGVAAAVEETCSDCTHELLDVREADVFNGQYTQQVVSFLQSNPDVKYVVSDSGQLGLGLGAAIEQAGLSDIKLYGVGPEREQIEGLQAGSTGAWAVYTNVVTGWKVADEIARIAVGDDPGGWLQDKSGYVLTSENSQDADPAGPEFPADYAEQFTALWDK